MAEESTQLCGNCKHDIPEANLTMHEIHCRRNIALCEACQEPVPRSELQQHRDQEHAQVQCKCGLKIEKRLIEYHQSSECAQRLVACPYCDLELAFSQSRQHEEYCGTRTEPCPLCKCNVMLREQDIHPALCGSLTPPQERSGGRAEPQSPGAWFETHSIHNLLRAQERSHNNNNTGASDHRAPPRPLEGRLHNSTRGTVGMGARRNTAPRNNDFSRLLEQEGELGNNNNSPLWPLGQLPGYDSSSLDYLLALSLQSDGELDELGGQQGVWTDVWEHRMGRTPSHSSLNPQLTAPNNNHCNTNTAPTHNQTEIMLPCEFCEELFPEEDLILHQTGCSPASAIASFSKQAPSLQYEDRLSPGPGRLVNIPPPRTPSPPTLPHSVSPLSYSPPSSPLDGDVVIPCEFCGVALEENVVFHHQDKCDLRPQTAFSVDKVCPRKPLLPSKEGYGRSSPEWQRRLRHQADPGEELLEQASQGWLRPGSGREPWKAPGHTGLPSPGKNTNFDVQVKNRLHHGRPVLGGHAMNHAPLNEGHNHSSAASTGPTVRGRAEVRRSQNNTGTPKVPKKQNVEKEEE